MSGRGSGRNMSDSASGSSNSGSSNSGSSSGISGSGGMITAAAAVI